MLIFDKEVIRLKIYKTYYKFIYLKFHLCNKCDVIMISNKHICRAFSTNVTNIGLLISFFIAFMNNKNDYWLKKDNWSTMPNNCTFIFVGKSTYKKNEKVPFWFFGNFIFLLHKVIQRIPIKPIDLIKKIMWTRKTVE